MSITGTDKTDGRQCQVSLHKVRRWRTEAGIDSKLSRGLSAAVL